MTSAEAIAMLDRQLAVHGQPVSFKRGTGTVTQATGFVRSYTAEELVGTVVQGDRKVTVSPSDLGSYVPARDDNIAIAGSVGKVMEPEEIRIGSTVVRYNLQVRMAS